MSSPPDIFDKPQRYLQTYYQRHNLKTVGAILLSIVTLGVFPLICYFKPILWIALAYVSCQANQCSAVVFEEESTKRRHLFYVTYHSADEQKLRLAPFYCFKQTYLEASDYVRLRVDLGNGLTMQYDDKRCFVPYVNDRHAGNISVSSDQSAIGEDYLEAEACWLNKDKDDKNELVGFQKVTWRIFVLYFAWLFSGGICWLFCYWHPFLQLHLTHRRCSLLSADTILIMTPPIAKDEKSAGRIFAPWLEYLFSSGVMIGVFAIIPFGLLLGLGLLIFFYITLRPYHVRPMKHATRDGQRVVLLEPKQKCANYFASTSCSEGCVVKFFTWQKAKYVWSGIAGSLMLYRFERQGGLIAVDEETSLPHANLAFKHQILGIVPTLQYFHSCVGLSVSQASNVRALIGANKMDLPLTPLFIVFLREILTPFYLFQTFTVIVWIIDDYRVYAYIIIALSALSAIWQIVAIRLEEVALRKTMHKSSLVEIARPGVEANIFQQPDVLVPSDVILIPSGGCVMQCDAVLLNGTCLVDEAMLTGESVPVLKFALPPIKSGDTELLQIRKNERNILFCGTRILQANAGQQHKQARIRAVVIRTGFMTAKGELTRLILYPKPFDFQFAADAVKFVGMMSAIAFIGMLYSIGLRVYREEETKIIVLRSLDIITIAVPPALPIALTIGYMMAKRRLQRNSIYCTSPSVINLAGCIDAVCVDKTGTMTEGGLDFEKLLPAVDGHFMGQVAPGHLPDGPLLRCLVTCHSLALVNGKAIGDPMEEKMFEMAGWKLSDSFQESEKAADFAPIAIVRPPQLRSGRARPPNLCIVRQLPFSSHFQRMSVVACPVDGKTMSLYLKGAPETVVSICRITTVPADLDIHLGALTECGYRVLGLATRSLSHFSLDDILSADRNQLENCLDFLGLLVFENKLKPETCGVVEKLKKANMRIVMLTGDNPLTAVSVARQAGIIDDVDQVLTVNAMAPVNESGEDARLDYVEIKQAFPKQTAKPVPFFKESKKPRPPTSIIDMLPIAPPQPLKLVVTGSSWSVIKQYFPSEIERILMRGAVFARVNPNQKKEIIEGLQRIGYYALMCGDGANDCGALRAACTGISLSQAEASVASPFTSKVENIDCIHRLIREGRCALVTSFAIFRFMLLYALTQFISCFILYYCRANLSEYGFLYTDLFLATTLVFTMSFTEAYDHLVDEKPPSSLLEIRMVLSLILQAILIIAFQVLAYLYCVYRANFWYLSFNPPEIDTETYVSFEYYSVYIVSVFQYPCIAIVLSKGIPFRKPSFTNWLFVLNLAINFAANLFIAFDPTPPFGHDPPNLVNEQYASFKELLVLQLPPTMEYRGVIFLFAFIFCFTSLITELVFVERAWLADLLTSCCNKLARNPKGSRRKYEMLEERLCSASEHWPPVKTSAVGAISIFSPSSIQHHESRPFKLLFNAATISPLSEQDLLASSNSISITTEDDKQTKGGSINDGYLCSEV